MKNVSSSNGQKANVPKLRFPGFDELWERKTLSQYLIENKRRNKSLEFSKKDVLSVSGEYGIVNQIAFQGRSFAGESVANYHIVYTNDIVYTKSPLKANPYGIIKVNNGVPGIVSTLYAVYHPLKTAIPKFVDFYFADDLRLNKFLKSLVNIGAKHDMKVNNEFVLTGTVYFPSVQEQLKIVEFLSYIDNRIAKQRQLVEALKKYKRGALSKLFPQKGETEPKYRFAGFTGAWEQRKFRELYKKSNEKNDGSIGMDKNITVATMQYKEDVKVSTDDYLKTYYTFKLGDIAFEGHQSKEFRFGRFVENDIGDGIVSHIFAVFRPIIDYDLNFWKYAINNESLMQRVLSRSTKASTMMHDLVTNDFLNEEFLVPKLEEQKKIGEYFSNLDSLITLHQRKLNEFNGVKSGLLQQLFI